MVFEFKFPDIGEGIHEGKVLQLKLNVGDSVTEGDIVAIVETDKVVAEIPSPKTGIIKKFGAEEGQIIHVGQVLVFIEIEGSETSVPEHEEEEEKAPTVVGEIESAKGGVLPASGEGLSDTAYEAIGLVPGKFKVLATPIARKLARDLNIDIHSIKGSGPGGRVMKHDIRSFSDKPRATPIEALMPQEPAKRPVERTATPASALPTLALPTASIVSLTSMVSQPEVYRSAGDVIEMSTMRRTIAANMMQSQAIPVAVAQDYGIIDELVQLRKEINAERGANLSFQLFFFKAVAATLKQFPKINSTFHPDKQEIRVHKSVNIGFAVDTEAGLLVPVIKEVERRSIIEIDGEMQRLVTQAKNRTIQLDDLQNGTISITNYGPFGGIYGKPMILPPQVAIIGFGRIHQTPVVKDNQVVPGWVLPVSISFDHRVVDGAEVGLFLTHLLKNLGSVKQFMIAM